MRKLWLLVVLAIVSFSHLSAQATPLETLVNLAAYYPANTQQYVAVRTDPAYLDMVQQFLNRLDKLAPNQNIADALDGATQGLVGKTFKDGIAGWLGDAIAFGSVQTEDFARAQIALNGTAVQPILVSATVKNRAKAKEFVDAFLKKQTISSPYTIAESGDFTVWTPKQDFGYIFAALNDDYLFISTDQSLLPVAPVSDSLLDVEAFTATLGLLPETNYNVVIYQDSYALYELQRLGISAGFTLFMDSAGDVPPTPEWLKSILRPQAIGLTFDKGTFIFDTAQAYDADFNAQLGMDYSAYQPLDASFTQTIPANTFAFIQSANFQLTMQQLFTTVDAIDQLLADSGGITALMGLPQASDTTSSYGGFTPQLQTVLNTFSTPGTAVAVFNNTFSGLTGLSYERDVVPALDGDVVSYVRLLPATDASLGLPVIPDFVVEHQISQQEGATALLEGLISASEAYGSNYPVEEANGTKTLVINLLNQIAEKNGQVTYPFVDILIGVGDGVFAWGTRNAVNDSLKGGFDKSIADTPAFQHASQYFLPDAQQLMYFSTQNLIKPIEDYFTNSDQKVPAELVQVRDIIALIESGSATSTVSNQAVVSRLTLTVSGEKK